MGTRNDVRALRGQLVMRLTLAVAIALLLAAFNPPHAAQSDQDKGWLHYEPEVVTLRGRLTKTTEYGPPNYGENPESDSVEHPIILILARPVRVQGDPGSELNSESFTNVTQVQLVIFDGVASGYSRFFERDVEVTGTLFARHTGHHHTDVLLIVQTLAPAASQR